MNQKTLEQEFFADPNWRDFGERLFRKGQPNEDTFSLELWDYGNGLQMYREHVIEEWGKQRRGYVPPMDKRDRPATYSTAIDDWNNG